MPRQADRDGHEVAAIVGVLSSVLGMLEGGATHLGVATDHVIESFRNDLWPGYKTSEGVEPELLAQFHPLEDALRDVGVVVWAMVEFEADDALASAAQRAAKNPAVEQVIICTPDKDLSQCITDDRVVQFDRRKREQRNERGVKERFGVSRPCATTWRSSRMWMSSAGADRGPRSRIAPSVSGFRDCGSERGASR